MLHIYLSSSADYVELRPNTWETVLVNTIEQVACDIDRAIIPLVQFLTETLDQCCSTGNSTRTTSSNDSLSALAYQLTFMLVQLFKVNYIANQSNAY
jgi:hypothetical protein